MASPHKIKSQECISPGDSFMNDHYVVIEEVGVFGQGRIFKVIDNQTKNKYR